MGFSVFSFDHLSICGVLTHGASWGMGYGLVPSTLDMDATSHLRTGKCGVDGIEGTGWCKMGEISR